jgi:DNA-binding MarR family transcriptional regulator
MSGKRDSRGDARTGDGEDRGNLLGALLRLSHQALLSEVMATMAKTEFKDVQGVHSAALRPLWDAPDGMRVTDMAREARITKQSMQAIVDELESLGYVERLADPTDGRAKLVRLTKRGRRVGPVMRDAVRRVETDWAKRIGARRIEELRRTLADLVASFDASRE